MKIDAGDSLRLDLCSKDLLSCNSDDLLERAEKIINDGGDTCRIGQKTNDQNSQRFKLPHSLVSGGIIQGKSSEAARTRINNPQNRPTHKTSKLINNNLQRNGGLTREKIKSNLFEALEMTKLYNRSYPSPKDKNIWAISPLQPLYLYRTLISTYLCRSRCTAKPNMLCTCQPVTTSYQNHH